MDDIRKQARELLEQTKRDNAEIKDRIRKLPTAANYWAFTFGVGAGIAILIVSFGLVFLVAALFK